MQRRNFICMTLAGAAAAAHGTESANAPAPVLLVFGDSLSAEYGIARGSGWVALLEKRSAPPVEYPVEEITVG